MNNERKRKMRIVILGQDRSRDPLVRTLQGLGFTGDSHFGDSHFLDFPENLFVETRSLFEAEQVLVFYDPVNFLVIERVISSGRGWDMSCEEALTTLTTGWREHCLGCARVVLMPPAFCSSNSFFESVARRAGIPFLADPSDPETVKKCFGIETKEIEVPVS